MQPAPGMDVSIGQGHPVAPWIKHAPTIITVGMIVDAGAARTHCAAGALQ
jgi:hypothetical protein